MEAIIKGIFNESKFKGLCACAGVLVGGIIYEGLVKLGSDGKMLCSLKKLCDGISEVLEE